MDAPSVRIYLNTCDGNALVLMRGKKKLAGEEISVANVVSMG